MKKIKLLSIVAIPIIDHAVLGGQVPEFHLRHQIPHLESLLKRAGITNYSIKANIGRYSLEIN